MRTILIAFTNIEYTIQLAEGLAKLVDITLMLPEDQARRFHGKIDPIVTVHAFKQPRLRYPTNILFVYKMVKKFAQLKPDIIHIQRGHPWFNFALPYLKRRYCLITTIHDVILHSGDKESSIIPPFTHTLAIKSAHQIIVHGNKLKEEMISEYKIRPENVHVLRRGINSIYLRYIDNQVSEKGPSILFFGRIWEYKGLKYLIEAEPDITRAVPGAKIVIAGRGEDVMKEYYDMMVNKENFIIHNQHIPNEMVAELFQEASVVVFPYTDASQSGVVPLAYAFKRPVVITNVGSLPEVVDDGVTGFIVPPKDSKKLAEAIIDILKDDKKRQRMGENALNKANQELSWDSIAEKTVKIYEKVLAKKT